MCQILFECKISYFGVFLCVCVLVIDEACISVYSRVSANTCTPDFAGKAA